ncbi:MAG TPA: hypothetical protein VEW46_17180 [Pyrinomonadaceae bacterium]|nr:hypothetical protein [Pyrinomonadaceae bacterium]
MTTKRRLLLFRSLLTLTLLLACESAALVQAQIDQWGYWQNGVSESWWFSKAEFTTAQADEAISRWKNIGDELQNTSYSEWAGTYFSGGETHGTYMRWSVQKGFIIAHIDKCQAKVMGVTYGTVEVSPTVIKFLPEFNNADAKNKHQHSHSGRLASIRFVPVKVDRALLLIKEDDMRAFGDFMAGLGTYNFSDFHYVFTTEFLTKFVVEGQASNSKDVKEDFSEGARPVVIVPAGYDRFLKRPIEATITGVGRRQVRKQYSYQNSNGTGESFHDGVSLTTVSVSAGARQGLKQGMFIRIVKPHEGERIRIVRAGKFSSTGIVIRSLVDGSETFFDGKSDTAQRHSKIVPGWKLTTAPF